MHSAQPPDENGHRRYIIIPFNMLPIEKDGHGSLSDLVEERRKEIFKTVLDKDNAQISADTTSMKWLRTVGSDLNINAFAINWYRSDGTINTELEEANYLMKRVVNRLSITTTTGDPRKVPLFLTSTQFEPALYGQCAQNFMRRLGLDACAQDLWVLRNVVMSPFPTDKDFIQTLMYTLQQVIIEEVEECRKRNSLDKKEVVFLLRGTDVVFLDFQTSFHRATQRQQIIIKANLEENTQEDYKKLRKRYPRHDIAFRSKEPQHLEELVNRVLEGKVPEIEGEIGVREAENFIGGSIKCSVQMDRIVKSSPLNSANRDDHYPRHFMPFYLYGSADQYHISHMLLQAPNVNLSACEIKLSKKLSKTVHTYLEKSKALILTLTDYREETMHPFPQKNDDSVLTSEDFFFRPGSKLKVKVYEDPNGNCSKGPGLIENLGTPIGRGEMTLGDDVHVDVELLNQDPLVKQEHEVEWDKELDKIKDVLNAGRGLVSGVASTLNN